MAQKFLSLGLKSVGSGGSSFAAVPASKAWIVLACNVANASGTGQQTGRITYTRSGVEYDVVPAAAQIPVGGSLLGAGADGKDVLLPGDVVKVYVATGTGDVWLSYMEVDQA
jgi:hypothetical protein